MKKYKLTREKKEVCGRTVYRIKALRGFHTIIGREVQKGDLGGWVESEKNLSHEGNCWLFDDATGMENSYRRENSVGYENSRQYGNSKQYGNSQQSGYSCQYGYSRQLGNSWQSGNSRQFENSQQFGNSQQSGYSCQYGYSRQFGDSWQSGHSWQSGNSQQLGNSRQFGYSHQSENSKQSGYSLQFGNSQQLGNSWQSGNSQQYGNSQQFGYSIMSQQQLVSEGITTKNLDDDIVYSLAAQLGVVPIKNKIILYKRVNKVKNGVYRSMYDDDFIYKKGKLATVKLPDLSNASCSDGIHVARALYWEHGDTLIACEVNVKDIITVQEQKVRCKKVKVLGEVEI